MIILKHQDTHIQETVNEMRIASMSWKFHFKTCIKPKTGGSEQNGTSKRLDAKVSSNKLACKPCPFTYNIQQRQTLKEECGSSVQHRWIQTKGNLKKTSQ